MTVNLEDLTPEEMCAGLMRGNASTLKLDYDYRAATLTVSSYKDLVEKDVLEDLRSFARGFSDGMAVSLERANPGKHYERVGESNVDRVGSYSIGYAMGSGEDGFRLYPAIREVETEMREHGIPEDKITETWDAGRAAGKRACNTPGPAPVHREIAMSEQSHPSRDVAATFWSYEHFTDPMLRAVAASPVRDVDALRWLGYADQELTRLRELLGLPTRLGYALGRPQYADRPAPVHREEGTS